MNKKYYRNNIHRLQLLDDEDIDFYNRKPIKKFRDIGTYDQRKRSKRIRTPRITKILL